METPRENKEVDGSREKKKEEIGAKKKASSSPPRYGQRRRSREECAKGDRFSIDFSQSYLIERSCLYSSCLSISFSLGVSLARQLNT